MTTIPKGEGRKSWNRPKLRTSHAIAFFILIVVVGGLLFSAFGFYFIHWRGDLARQVSHFLPLPAASVEGDKILYRDIAELAVLLEQSNGDGIFNDPWDEALELAIKRKHTEHLAQEMQVFIGSQTIADYKLDEAEIADLLTAIDWTSDDYRKYIVGPLLLSQKLEQAVFDSQIYQESAYDRAELIMDNIELGISFTDLARQYSQDLSSSLGGDFGYVTMADLDEGLEDIFDLEAGETSDILEGPEYFAIAYVYDVVPNQEDGGILVGLQLITVNKNGLSYALSQYMTDREVIFYVR
ncbi:MAG: peptidylprolyl isomerase [Patescibacteria group bacterium]